jgi:hypothetical protein
MKKVQFEVTDRVYEALVRAPQAVVDDDDAVLLELAAALREQATTGGFRIELISD